MLRDERGWKCEKTTGRSKATYERWQDQEKTVFRKREWIMVSGENKELLQGQTE